MKMSDSPAKRAWIEQVLGFRFPSELKTGKPDLGRRWQMACQAWRAANAAVDAQISALQAVLRSSGDPELMEIAEFGFNAVTGNHKARLTAMLFELGDAIPAGVQRSGSKALTLLSQFQTHIETDKRVAACDDNPSPVRVSIRATIGPALAGLQAALEAARSQ
jgi:hypothetical protein